MIRKNINFADKKVNKRNVYKNKKLSKTDKTDDDKILVSKRESYGKKIHLNTSLDIMMMMMSLDYYR